MSDRRGLLGFPDGTSFSGTLFGASSIAQGEVSFVTHMTGYLELITDPCSAGQILVFTYPLIGNYGVFLEHVTSAKVHARALVVRELCPWPSNFEQELSLHEYLKQQGVTLLADVDTRAVTRYLRLHGAKQGGVFQQGSFGFIGSEEDYEVPLLRGTDTVLRFPEPQKADEVSGLNLGRNPYLPHPVGTSGFEEHSGLGLKIAVLDYGAAEPLVKELQRSGCAVTLFPETTAAAEVLAEQPDALMLSDGSGDPAKRQDAVEIIKELAPELPIFAFGLGHHLLAQAFGGRSFKMFNGHRGGNHPVRAVNRAQIQITRQNHGYAVLPESLSGTELQITHSELHDSTIEGLRHRNLPLWSLQYYPDCSELPLDQVQECAEFWQAVKERIV